MRLSPTQLALLCIIDEATLWNDDQLKRYWIPRPDRNERYTDVAGKAATFIVDGAGVVSALKALQAKGLTKRPRTDSPQPYLYCITETGRVLIEELRSAARPNRVE